jgi:hypothetical protein
MQTHTHRERESGISYVMSCTVFFFPTPINHEGENGYEKKKAEDSFSGIFVSRAGTVTIHLPISEEIPERFPPKPTSNKISTTIAEQDDRETNRILDTSG